MRLFISIISFLVYFSAYADFYDKSITISGTAYLNNQILANHQIICKQGDHFKSFNTNSDGNFEFTILYTAPCLNRTKEIDRVTEMNIKMGYYLNGNLIKFWSVSNNLIFESEQIWKNVYTNDELYFMDSAKVNMNLNFYSNTIGSNYDFVKHLDIIAEKRKVIKDITNNDNLIDAKHYSTLIFLYESFEWTGIKIDSMLAWIGINKNWNSLTFEESTYIIKSEGRFHNEWAFINAIVNQNSEIVTSKRYIKIKADD